MKMIKVITLLSTLMISSVASADLNTGLVSYWSFDDCTANDNSGNNIVGTLNNVSCINGIKSKAFSFNGVDSSIITHLPIVKKTYSVSMFAKFNSNKQNQLFYLGESESYPDRLGYLTTYPAGGHSWHWGSMDIAGTLWNTPSHWGDRAGLIDDPKGLLNNRWYHITFVLNDTDISLYVDGVLLKVIKSSYHSYIEDYSNLLFMLGMEVEGNPMDGVIDEVRFYNRVLSASEIKTLYNTAPILKGTVTWVQPPYSVKCTNNSTSKSVSIPRNKKVNYDCENAGLVVNSGDSISVTVTGNKQ